MTTRLLVVVAHPDDETFGCGLLLAYAAARGVETTVACATRGELGEIAPGLDVERAQLGAVRHVELRAAAKEFGVTHVVMFDWIDSGVDGDPAPGSLCAANLDEVSAVVANLIEEVQPNVVVALDASDGHRDHAKIRDATLDALARTQHRPSETYLWCLARSLMTAFTNVPTLGTRDDEITMMIDTSEFLEQRWRAIRRHASQVPPFDAMSPKMQRAFLTRECLRRLDPPPPGGPVATELFTTG
jgi:N-acetyl-1-D-myo-inositol-2-amino-2-deoxy-alpha-D-glucopyranoside deacetylase